MARLPGGWWFCFCFYLNFRQHFSTVSVVTFSGSTHCISETWDKSARLKSIRTGTWWQYLMSVIRAHSPQTCSLRHNPLLPQAYVKVFWMMCGHLFFHWWRNYCIWKAWGEVDHTGWSWALSLSISLSLPFLSVRVTVLDVVFVTVATIWIMHVGNQYLKGCWVSDHMMWHVVMSSPHTRSV